MSRSRKFLMGFTFALVAIGLAATSAAYACTVWAGKMTVTGSGATGSVSAQGWYSTMGYCTNPTGTAEMDASTSGTVTVSVQAASSGCFSSTLPSGTYDIWWTAGSWDPQNPGTNDCMADTADDYDVGDISVNGSGVGGPSTSSSFNPGTAGTIQVCVADRIGPDYAMQVPVTVA